VSKKINLFEYDGYFFAKTTIKRRQIFRKKNKTIFCKKIFCLEKKKKKICFKNFVLFVTFSKKHFVLKNVFFIEKRKRK